MRVHYSFIFDYPTISRNLQILVKTGSGKGYSSMLKHKLFLSPQTIGLTGVYVPISKKDNTTVYSNYSYKYFYKRFERFEQLKAAVYAYNGFFNFPNFFSKFIEKVHTSIIFKKKVKVYKKRSRVFLYGRYSCISTFNSRLQYFKVPSSYFSKYLKICSLRLKRYKKPIFYRNFYNKFTRKKVFKFSRNSQYKFFKKYFRVFSFRPVFFKKRKQKKFFRDLRRFVKSFKAFNFVSSKLKLRSLYKKKYAFRFRKRNRAFLMTFGRTKKSASIVTRKFLRFIFKRINFSRKSKSIRFFIIPRMFSVKKSIFFVNKYSVNRKRVSMFKRFSYRILGNPKSYRKKSYKRVNVVTRKNINTFFSKFTKKSLFIKRFFFVYNVITDKKARKNYVRVSYIKKKMLKLYRNINRLYGRCSKRFFALTIFKRRQYVKIFYRSAFYNLFFKASLFPKNGRLFCQIRKNYWYMLFKHMKKGHYAYNYPFFLGSKYYAGYLSTYDKSLYDWYNGQLSARVTRNYRGRVRYSYNF